MNLNEYFCNTLTCINKKLSLKLVLKIKTCWDGKKRDPKVITTNYVIDSGILSSLSRMYFSKIGIGVSSSLKKLI